MVYSPLIHKAIAFATKIHELDIQKKRKGKDIPYITHPITVGLILARITSDENIIAAGILHDTIEDCEPYGSITQKDIEQNFNKDVARIVDDLTEQDKNLSWAGSKKLAFNHIKDMDHDSLLVKSADVLHNLVELNQDIEIDGDDVFKKFNAPKDATLQRYKTLIPEIKRVWSENPLVSDLEIALGKLLEIIK